MIFILQTITLEMELVEHMNTEWNYTELAKPYLNRPDYSSDALNNLFREINQNNDVLTVCDIGAGVAHLTLPLLDKGFFVDAVEPNDAMRELGVLRTQTYEHSTWFKGTGEDTGRPSQYYDLVTFGSSFNVTDRPKALIETNRLLKSNGWFACMWNHRDLEDAIQKEVERIIQSFIPNYDYGTRREEQGPIIDASGFFKKTHYTQGNILHKIEKAHWLNAWESHATLARQAGDHFAHINERIAAYVNTLPGETLTIPYTTRIWFAQKK